MKLFLQLLFIGLCTLMTIMLSGCTDSTETTEPPVEVEDTDTTDTSDEEELVLPADSLGEGSEPKNSGPFGGAIPLEEATEEPAQE